MEASAARYARWKAPAEDRQVLIWPDPPDLLRDAQANHDRLKAADSVLLQGVPLSQVRSRMRQWVGHADDQLLFATGHQTELHHPGVWVKNALIDAAAKATGGRAFHFAVDTDEPKHLLLRWPGGSFPLSDDPAALKAEWSGLVAPPTPAHLAEVGRQFADVSQNWNFSTLVPEFLSAMRRRALGTSRLPDALAETLHEMDWGLGLRYDAMIVSPICLSEPYLLFVHHVLSRADKFATHYNAALDTFRRENKIRTPGRPMPNLQAVGASGCEVPFWLDSLSSGTRRRATVERRNEKWVLANGPDDEFVFDPAADGWDAAQQLSLWLRRHSLRLSPRALTLTAVFRLLIADQFVHGIGGGQYDQVLDKLIALHFGIEPPRFCVTTATLFFPEAAGQPRVCLPCLAQDGHRLKHQVLGDKKMEFVRTIASLPRRSAERSTLFVEMHQQLTAAWAQPGLRTWEQEFRDAEARRQRERVLFDRELFYAIQSPERLTDLIARYRTF
ncbi:MAG TPA: hypothetical protein VLJ39_12535 [Tepidisphaeraceae bacterium]|nr:hypothetical protein [Tepidisphaeraceae bacterium]